MAIHLKAFREELYTEHLEEASYLYETRLAWLEDEEIGWQDIADIDYRLEAHLDALIVGGQLALDLCLDNLAEADFSTLHIILRVFCRYRAIQPLSALWQEFDFDDAEKVRAVQDALKWECPQEWFAPLLNVFKQGKPEMFPLLVEAVVYGLRSEGEELLKALVRAEEKDLPILLGAISRVDRSCKPSAERILLPYLKSDDSKIKSRAAKALLMLGKNVAGNCALWPSEAPELLALAGNVSHSRVLLDLALKGVADDKVLLAMGVSGNLEVVPQLLVYLKHPDYMEAAAQALNIITGANLFVEEHVADEVEEDELFDNELDAFKKGELPKNIDGDPFGSEVKKIVVGQDVWQQWLDQYRGQFNAGVRYRRGKPFHVTTLVGELIDNQSPMLYRNWVYEELVMRYGLSLPFSADHLVPIQQQQLNAIHQWGHAGQWQSGLWYFDGHAEASQ